jgi:hypothetical protein
MVKFKGKGRERTKQGSHHRSLRRIFQKVNYQPGTLAHVFNPSYLGEGRECEDGSSRPAWVDTLISTNKKLV